MEETGKYATVIEHIEEFRQRLIKCLIILFLLFPVVWPLSQPFITWIWKTLCPPNMGPMYYMAPLELFTLCLKISAVMVICIGLPFIMWHIWSYVAPALYQKEKGFVFVLCMASLLLFVAGAAGALLGIFPLLMQFSVGMQTEGTKPFLNVSSCIEMAAWLMLGFGLAFQLPIILLALMKFRIVSVAGLRKLRPYIIIFIFIVSAIICPPDVMSLLLMAIPTYFLFEISLLIGVWTERK
jgi:sec-independent protein translocase protein TatC